MNLAHEASGGQDSDFGKLTEGLAPETCIDPDHGLVDELWVSPYGSIAHVSIDANSFDRAYVIYNSGREQHQLGYSL